MMKFSCARCGKRYVTHDVAVPGRIYRLKCKACGEFIVVRGSASSNAPLRPDAPAPEPVPPGATPPVEDADEPLATASGPMPPALAAPPLAPGDEPAPTPSPAPVDPAPSAMAAPSTGEPAEASPGPAGPAPGEPKYIELFDDGDPEAASAEPAPSPEPSPIASDDFRDVAEALGRSLPSAAPLLPTAPILPEVHDEPEASDSAEEAIRDFLAPLPADLEPIVRDVLPVGPLAQAKVTAPAPAQAAGPRPPPARGRRKAIPVIAGLAVLLVAGGGIAFWRRGSFAGQTALRPPPSAAPAPSPQPAATPSATPTPVPPTNTAPAAQPESPPPSPPAETPTSAAPSPTPNSTASPTPAPSAAPGGQKPPQAEVPAAKPARAATRPPAPRAAERPAKPAKQPERKVASSPRREVKEAAPEPAPQPVAAPPAQPPTEAAAREDTGPDLPVGLAPEQIQRVLGANRKSLDACLRNPSRGLDQPLGARQITLHFMVLPEGTVNYPTIDDVAISSAPLGQCLKTAARALSFPAFRGDPVPVDEVLSISGK